MQSLGSSASCSRRSPFACSLRTTSPVTGELSAADVDRISSLSLTVCSVLKVCVYIAAVARRQSDGGVNSGMLCACE